MSRSQLWFVCLLLLSGCADACACINMLSCSSSCEMSGFAMSEWSSTDRDPGMTRPQGPTCRCVPKEGR